MEIVWIIAGTILVLAGIAGSFLPVIPGPPLSYLGLLFIQFTSPTPFTIIFLVYWAIIVIVIMSLENILPAVGSNRMGGTKFGVYGCLIGGVAGLFLFPPLGLIFGPMIGAFVGEFISDQNTERALQAAIGSFIGFFVGTIIKVIVSLILAYYFFKAVLF